MYDTSSMRTNKEKAEKKMSMSISASNDIKCSGYNAFQTGHGAHGGSKKAKIRKSRKEGKAICRQY